MESQYEYEFTYRCNGATFTTKFNAAVDIEELKENLKLFLRGCSWQDSTLKFLEPEE